MILDWRITYGERHLEGNGGWLYVAEKMDEMKFDKSGGCTVLGIFKALSMLNIPINVVGIVPSV